MNLIQESFQRLFPEKEFKYKTEMEYNRRLNDFNANVRLYNNILKINLNLKWKSIDKEIKIGLIQHLLLKILKEKKHTPNIELYSNFIKNIPIMADKIPADPILEWSFSRINQRFFFNQMEQPNLKWGSPSRRKLASYNFHNDTITVSTLFQNAPSEILDYLLYHEMLHKQYQFQHRNGRSSFHSPEFKNAEQRYPRQKEVEKEINQIIKNSKSSKRKSHIWNFFR